MKTKKMRIFSKLFAALVVLTLISCCFMGTTFARYLSTTTGTALVNVAEWGITFADGITTKEFKVDFASLSPDMTERTTIDTSSKRTHSTGKVLVGTIKNTGDVTALVTINYENANSEGGPEGGPYEVVTLKSGKDYDTTGYSDNGGGVAGSGASWYQVYSLFSIELYYGYYEGASQTPLASGQQVSLAGEYDGGSNNDKIWIYAECVWTTHDELQPWVADAIDTWAGENVTQVGYTLNITAAQASEVPNA